MSLWLLGALALGLVFLLLRGQFSAEARARRRLEKSNRRLVSRKQGPTVKLAANVGKRKGYRKR